MIEGVLLGGLVLCDGVFAGFRAGAGRDPRLYKVDYYLRAAWQGAIAAALAILLVLALVAFLLVTAGDATSLLDAYMRSAHHLLWIYGVYATIVLAAMGMWTYPSPDVRTLASVLVLGPFTLLRPYVVVAGGVVALVMADRLPVRATCLFAVGIQLSLQPWLDLRQAKAQRNRFGPDNASLG